MGQRRLSQEDGRIVLDVNEAYTSKTYCGRLMNNLAGKKSFKVPCVDGRIKLIDRDTNGARNIIIRFISKNEQQT